MQNDLGNFDMTKVQAQGEFKELEIGKYLVRIEDVGRKKAKDKTLENGDPHPDNGKNSMLCIDIKIYGGPDEGHEETEHLNLWHVNQDTVRMALATLKSIQLASNVHTSTSDDLRGKWMMLEIYLNRVNKKAKKWEMVRPEWIPSDVPAPGASKYAVEETSSAAQGSAPQHTASAPNHTPHAAAPVHTAAPVAAADDTPDWAKRK